MSDEPKDVRALAVPTDGLPVPSTQQVTITNLAVALGPPPPRVERQMVALPPSMGGDVKNIRRRLEAPSPDWQTFVAAIVSVCTTIATVVKNADIKNGLWWIVIPILLAGGSGLAAMLKLYSTHKARKNPDLLQAQKDADVLIGWQEDARIKVDLEFHAQLEDAERIRRYAIQQQLLASKKS